jgi:DNA modification methylase
MAKKTLKFRDADPAGIEIKCAYQELLSVKELAKLRDEKNRNIHPPEQIVELVEQFKHQGVRHPIIISKRSGKIVAGDGRLQAAMTLGMDKYPVDRQAFKDSTEEYEFAIADNAIAGWAHLDLSAINMDLPDLGPELNIDRLAIKDFVLDMAEKGGECDADETPEPEKEAKVKPGELYILGNHRLLCGDSTDAAQVERLMGGERADMVFTSPPYNAAKESHLNGRVKGFENKYQSNSDSMTDDEYLAFLVKFTDIAVNTADYVFVNLQLLAHNKIPLAAYWAANKNQTKDVLIWNKAQCPPNIVEGAFNTKFEFIFCFSKDSKTRGFPAKWRGQYPNVVETESNAANEHAGVHRAGFPVALPIWFLDKLPFAKTIYEPFTGSGSTLIACEKTNRKCYGMEIDPIYCGVILDRWEKFSGQKAQREDGVLWQEIKAE